MFLKKKSGPDRDTGSGFSRKKALYSVLILLLSPIAAFQCVEWFTHNPWTIMTFKVFLWNVLFYEMVYLLLFFLTGSIRIACLTGSFLFLVIGLGNYFVVEFRSAPIVPWDIYSVRTAASVAENYDYTLSLQAGICLGIFVLLLVLAFFARWKPQRFRWPLRLGLSALTCVLMAGYTVRLHDTAFIKSMKLDNTLFTPYYMSRKNGFTTAFLMDLKYLKVSEPEGYRAEEEEEILSRYTAEEAGSRPNIIVIMNEAFSDPAILGDFAVNEDYMPYVHQLQQDTAHVISGMLNVSVKGGNTANTEYEFLTGASMRFLPAGSVPYQQYIFGPKPNLVSWLESLGYQTAAIHPYNSTGWNRDKVYEYFGFDQLIFNSGFKGATRIRKYIDDASCFDKIIDLYENKTAPMFTFAVTMQNHSGYFEDFDNFDVNIHATDCDSRILDRYLSLMKLSDTAFEDLTDYFMDEEEEVIIVFFGDHQPNDVVVEPVWKLQGKKGSALTDEENDLRYQVPYVIWSNRGLKGSGGSETSVNYLAGEVLAAAGLPLSPYLQYQAELKDQLPVLSTQRLTGSGGAELTEDEESASGDVLAYRKMQYYRMFDAK